MADVFISYAREDQPFVLWLRDRLVEAQRDVWVDVEGIAPSAQWMDEIRVAIDGAGAFVFIVSPDSLTSPTCRQELDHAVAAGKRLVPVVYRDAGATPVPDPVAAVNWVFARPEDDHGAALTAIARALDTDHDWVRDHTRLHQRATDWRQRKDDPGLLLRGNALVAAEAALASHLENTPRPTELQASFVLASRHAESRRQRRLVVVAVGVLTVVAILAVVAIVQGRAASRQRDEARRQRDTALSRQLAADAVAQLPIDPQRSLLLAREADRLAPTSEAVAVLRQATFDTRALHVFTGPTKVVKAVAFSADGKRLASGSSDGTVRVWDLAGTAKPVVSDQKAAVVTVAWAPDGSLFAGSLDGRVARYDVASGKATTVYQGDSSSVTRIAVSADGTHVAIGGASGVIHVVAAGGREEATLTGQDGLVVAIAFSPDGAVIVTGDSSGVVRQWGWMQSDAPGAAGQAIDGQAFGYAFNPAGNGLAVGGLDGSVTVYDQTLQQPVVLRGHKGTVPGLAYLPDGHHLLTGGTDGTVRVWDLAEPNAPPAVFLGHEGEVEAVAVAPDGASVASAGGDGLVRVWRATAAGDPILLDPASGQVFAAAVSGDGMQVATGTENGAAQIWTLAPVRPSVAAPGATVSSVAVSPDGTRTAIGRVGGTVEVLAGAGPVAVPGFDTTVPVRSVAWSADGKAIAAGDSANGSLALLDAGTLAVKAAFGPAPSPVFAVAVSADGRLAAGGSDGIVRVWSVAHPAAKAAELTGSRGIVNGLAFRPRSDDLAAAGEDGTVLLWRGGKGTPVVLRGHSGPVNGVAFSADGRWLASASDDGTVRVWDVSAAAVGDSLVLRAGDTTLYAVGISRDGSLIAAGGADGLARVWHCDVCVSVAAVRKLAAQRTVRSFTAEERTEFLAGVPG